jgi:hypothetical protein
MRTFVTIVPARPDIFTASGVVGPGGRAKLFNVTNTVQTTEPFAVRTIMRKGNRLVASKIRIYLTGIPPETGASFIVSIKGQNMALTNITLVEPGIYTADFELLPALEMAGDQPVVVTASVGGATFSSRLEDTAPRVRIL